jgi:hypothetical protein
MSKMKMKIMIKSGFLIFGRDAALRRPRAILARNLQTIPSRRGVLQPTGRGLGRRSATPLPVMA